MLDINFIREYPDRVKTAIRQKNVGQEDQVDLVLEYDAKHRAVLTVLQQTQAEANKAAASIGELMRTGDRDAAETAKLLAAENKGRVRDF